MNNQFIITTIITVILALSGYFFKYMNDLKIAKRKDNLDRVNKQLKELYGPLLSLTSSSKSSWLEFRKKYRNYVIGYFDKNNPPSKEEEEIWRIWMTTVFQPINEKIYNLTLKNGDLIIEDKFPRALKELCAHFESYKPVIAQWKTENFAEHLALLKYPSDIDKYVEQSYERLKMIQKKLIE